MKEKQVELTKELLKVSEDEEGMPVEKGGYRSALKGNKEMTDLLEVMKKDHETLVDTITILKA